MRDPSCDHINKARRAAERFFLQIGAFQARTIQLECLRSGELQSSADVLPRSHQRRQQRDGAHRHGAAFAALHSVVEPDGRGPRGGVFPRQPHDFLRRDASELRGALRRPFANAFAQTVEPAGVALHVVGVVQVLGHDHVHHGERQSGVAARMNEEMFVGSRAGAIAPRVNGIELGAVPPRFHNEGPQMYVGAENVGAPGEDQPRMAELLRLGSVTHSQRLGHSRGSGSRTDSAVEARGAQAVKEPAIHARTVQQPHGSGVAIGQDGLGSEFICDGAQTAGDGIQRFVPGDALEAPLALGPDAALRIEQASRRIFAFEVLRHFTAEKSAGHGMRGVAAELGGVAVVDGDQQGTAIRTVECADGTADFRHLKTII